MLLSVDKIIGQIFSNDTYADETVVSRVVEAFENFPKIKMLYGIQDYIDRTTGELILRWGKDSEPSEIKKRPYMPHPTIFTKREVYDTVGLFRKDYKCALDYEWEMRVLKFTRPYFLDHTIARMRHMGTSGTYYLTSFKETVRALWEHGYYFASIMMGIRNTAKFILIKLGLSGLLFRLWARNVSPKAEGPR